jgi:hypothetical protein
VTSVEGALLDIDREAFAVTIAAADELLALVNDELAEMQAGVDRM